VAVISVPPPTAHGRVEPVASAATANAYSRPTSARRERPLRRSLLRRCNLGINRRRKAVRKRNARHGVITARHKEFHHRIPAVAPRRGVVAEFVTSELNAAVLACGAYALIKETMAVLFSAS